jgi:hypothetical protein
MLNLSRPFGLNLSASNTLRCDFSLTGFRIVTIEEMRTPVMEATDSAGLIAWIRAFGLARLVKDLPESIQSQWERDVIQAAEGFRDGAYIRLGGVTRLVLAEK